MANWRCSKCGKPIDSPISIMYRTNPLRRYCYDCYHAEEEEKKKQRRQESTLKRAAKRFKDSHIRSRYQSIKNLARQGIKPIDIAYAFDMDEDEVYDILSRRDWRI